MISRAVKPESPGRLQGNAMKSRPLALPLAAALSLVLAAPAVAQSSPPPPPPPGAVGPVGPGPDQAGFEQAGFEQARADWLAECRRHHGNGKLVGGAVLGGLVGGVVGNRVAGDGNRTAGTVVGAAVGAVAGGAIGSAADRNDARDYCAAYLEQYLAQQRPAGYGYGQPVAYGYAPMMVMVPVAYVPLAAPARQARDCQETIVTEEWVSEPERPHRRLIPPRPRPDKRVRVVTDKRVRT